MLIGFLIYSVGYPKLGALYALMPVAFFVVRIRLVRHDAKRKERESRCPRCDKPGAEVSKWLYNCRNRECPSYGGHWLRWHGGTFGNATSEHANEPANKIGGK